MTLRKKPQETKMQSVFKLPAKEPSTHLNAATDLRAHLALIIDAIEIIQGLQIGPCQDHFGSEGMDHGFQCFHCFFAQCMFHSFHMFLETNCHAMSVWHQCEVSVCPVMLTQRCLSLEYPAFQSDRWQLSNQTPAGQ